MPFTVKKNVTLSEQICQKIGSERVKYCTYIVSGTELRTDGQTDGRTEGRTDGQAIRLLDAPSRPFRPGHKNSCPQKDLNRQPWGLSSDALPTERRWHRWKAKLNYFNGLYAYMFFRYQCIQWWSMRILSCKCSVLWILDIFLYLHMNISILYK